MLFIYHNHHRYPPPHDHTVADICWRDSKDGSCCCFPLPLHHQHPDHAVFIDLSADMLLKQIFKCLVWCIGNNEELAKALNPTTINPSSLLFISSFLRFLLLVCGSCPSFYHGLYFFSLCITLSFLLFAIVLFLLEPLLLFFQSGTNTTRQPFYYFYYWLILIATNDSIWYTDFFL